MKRSFLNLLFVFFLGFFLFCVIDYLFHVYFIDPIFENFSFGESDPLLESTREGKEHDEEY